MKSIRRQPEHISASTRPPRPEQALSVLAGPLGVTKIALCAPMVAQGVAARAPERPATVSIALPEKKAEAGKPKTEVIDRRAQNELFAMVEDGRLGGRRKAEAKVHIHKEVGTAAAALKRYGTGPVEAKMLAAFADAELAREFADVLRGLHDCGRMERVDVSASLMKLTELMTAHRERSADAPGVSGPSQARARRDLPAVLATYLERIALTKIEQQEINRDAVALIAGAVHDLKTKSLTQTPVFGDAA